MVTKKLKRLFLITLIPIYLHGIEEVITGFPHIDSLMRIGARYFNTSPEQFYWISHIFFWMSLPILYLLFYKNTIAFFLFSVFGLFYVVELHHIVKALYFKNYYPGLITASVYPFIGILYWKELLINWKRTYGNH